MQIPFREISRAEMRKRLQDTFYEKETSKLLKGLGEDCRSKPQVGLRKLMGSWKGYCTKRMGEAGTCEEGMLVRFLVGK